MDNDQGGNVLDEMRDRVARVREFNRFWTRQIGVLQAGLLSTPDSLTEARVLFELAHRDSIRASSLGADLGLDRGYLSRILSSFKERGLVESEPSPDDGRRQILRLTDSGRAEFNSLDEKSSSAAADLLTRLPGEEQSRLVAAMETIRATLDGPTSAAGFVIRPPRAGDLGWVVQRHGAIYFEEYRWDETFEALVARIVADYVDDHDPIRESFWVAERAGTAVGSVFCCRRDDVTAQLRLLLVEPRARGLGIGARLVEECIAFARRAGYEQMVLWTNDILTSARRIYEAAGFELTDEDPHHSFGHDLVGQHWALDLGSPRRSR